MEVVCTHCGQLCWAPEEQAGSELLCPVCDKSFVAVAMPEPLPSSAEPADLLSREVPVAFGPMLLKRTTPGGKTRKSARRKIKIKVLGRAAAAMVLLVCGVSLAAWLNARSKHPAATEGSHATEATASEGNVEFRPDPELEAQLAYTRPVEQFVLDLPPNYILFNVLSDPPWLPRGGHFVGVEFRGPAGARALMNCLIVTFSEREPLRGGLDKALDRFFTWLQHNAALLKLRHTPGEVGKLGQRFCIRSEFSGDYRAHGKTRTERREGTAYVMIEGDRQICLYTFCVPEEAESRRLLETSILTWRNKAR